MVAYAHAWSSEELEILTRNWTDGLPLVRLMKLLGAGITRNAMLAKAHELGLPEHAGTQRAKAKKRIDDRAGPYKNRNTKAAIMAALTSEETTREAIERRSRIRLAPIAFIDKSRFFEWERV